jgi:hypothetical protein
VVTTIEFTPPPRVTFQVIMQLDAQLYNVEVRWNIFGQRWYFNINNADGSPVVTLPLIGSPPGDDISLTQGYFNSTVIYREATRVFEINP